MERNYCVEWRDKGDYGHTSSLVIKAESAEQAAQKVKRQYPNRIGEIINVRAM